MDNLAWFIFIAHLSGNIKCGCELLCLFSLAGIAIFGFMLGSQLNNYWMHNKSVKVRIKTYKKYIKLCVISCICFGILSLAFPSTKILAAMYVLPKIANNTDIQHTVNDNIKSLRLLSEKWLRELIHGDDKKEVE